MFFSCRYYETTNDTDVLQSASDLMSRFLWRDFKVNHLFVISYVKVKGTNLRVSMISRIIFF